MMVILRNRELRVRLILTARQDLQMQQSKRHVLLLSLPKTVTAVSCKAYGKKKSPTPPQTDRFDRAFSWPACAIIHHILKSFPNS
jgi:hypothetical protein